LEGWRTQTDVEWVRFVADGKPLVLRRSVESLIEEFTRTADPAVGVAAVLTLQALVLARLDEEPAV